MDTERLQFLAKFALLINSSLELRKIVSMALRHLQKIVPAEACTVFLRDNADTVSFWALHGEKQSSLEGKKLPIGKGIVGWVIQNRQSALIPDAKKDSRFFAEVDKEAGFETHDLICIPLLLHGKQVIGAIEIINSVGNPFSPEDVAFAEQFANQVAIAIDNARLHRELVEYSEKLEVLNRRKDEMMSVITHEFRTPFSIIQNAADMLTSGVIKDPEALRSMAETLQKGVARLTRVIDQIRNVSLITGETLKPERAPIAIKSLFSEIENLYKPVADSRKQTLVIELDREVNSIDADPALLRIVLSNLLANAIRFTPDAGKIALSAKSNLGLVEIAVRDTGVGIEAKEIPLIFEKFYEVGSALAHGSGEFGFLSGGLGLGLPTCQAILGAHGSKLEVESTPSAGSVFRFHLPHS